MRTLPFVEELQRVGFLALIPPLLRGYGVDPLGVLRTAGLGADSLNDPESRIPYAAMGILLESAVLATRCPHFGLEIGKRINLASLGTIGRMMRNAPTVRTALQDFAIHHHINAQGGVAYLLDSKGGAFFGYAVYQKGMRGYSVICDGAGIAAVNLVCELLGAKDGSALEVQLSRSEPQDLAPYLRAFGSKPQFNADQTAVFLPAGLLDRPVAGADPVIWTQIKEQLLASFRASGIDTLTQLRRMLRIGLIRGDVSAADTAQRLGLGRRTLQRRLDTLGVSFQEVLDETRGEFVQQLLAHTDLNISDIGGIVGYSDPSVLTRGFMRWAGVTPSLWRAKSRANTVEMISAT